MLKVKNTILALCAVVSFSFRLFAAILFCVLVFTVCVYIVVKCQS